MKVIAILNGGYESYEVEQQIFAQSGYSLQIFNGPREQVSQQYDFAQDAEGILVRSTPINETALKKMPQLKAIVRYGVGYDNVDLPAVKARGIRVANVQGYANHAVSDHALALLYACIRDLESPWKETFSTPAREDRFELHDKTLGIIGIGRIGSEFCRKATPLFNQVLAYDPYKDVDYMREVGARKCDLATLLKQSHVISLHCNLTEETRHLLDASCFEKMEKRPVVINTARGPVIHEPDLMESLEIDRIHSAGLDVYEQEPPGVFQRQLIDHPRVVATPHIAWHSDYAMQTLQKRAAENMIGLLTGEPVSDEL